MGIPFENTIMGNRFFAAQFPRLIKAIERLADAVEEANRLWQAAKTEDEIQEITYNSRRRTRPSAAPQRKKNRKILKGELLIWKD